MNLEQQIRNGLVEGHVVSQMNSLAKNPQLMIDAVNGLVNSPEFDRFFQNSARDLSSLLGVTVTDQKVQITLQETKQKMMSDMMDALGNPSLAAPRYREEAQFMYKSESEWRREFTVYTKEMKREGITPPNAYKTAMAQFLEYIKKDDAVVKTLVENARTMGVARAISPDNVTRAKKKVFPIESDEALHQQQKAKAYQELLQAVASTCEELYQDTATVIRHMAPGFSALVNQMSKYQPKK